MDYVIYESLSQESGKRENNSLLCPWIGKADSCHPPGLWDEGWGFSRRWRGHAVASHHFLLCYNPRGCEEWETGCRPRRVDWFLFCFRCYGKIDIKCFSYIVIPLRVAQIVSQKEGLRDFSVPMSHEWQPKVLVCPVEECVRSDLSVWQAYCGFQWSGKKTILNWKLQSRKLGKDLRRICSAGSSQRETKWATWETR